MEVLSRHLVYKRFTLALILSTAAVIFLKISLNKSVLQMAQLADFWNRTLPHFPETDSFGRSRGSLNNTFNSNTTKRQTIAARPLNFIARATAKIINISDPYKPLEAKGNFKHEETWKMIASGKIKIEDLMTVGPFHFLKNYKNPCWISAKRNKTEVSLRCLPYFYLIGAPKSGTTDLYRRLIQHPNISRLVVKEPHWLTRKHYYFLGRKKISGLVDYLKFFTYATREIYMKKDANGYHSKIFGDCSASTMWDNNYWTVLPQYRNLSEPKYTNADYIYHLNPKAKIIAMLRNPVDRLYSDFLFFQHGSPQKFHEGVVNTINATHECLRHFSLRQCLYTPTKKDIVGKVRLKIGVYHQHLKEFFRVFPRDQIMVIKLEDFSKKTAAYMQRLFTFLELPELEQKVIAHVGNPNRRANQRKKNDRQVGEMLPRTRALLEEFYRPHNELLTELLGEKFNYNRDIVS